MEIDIRLTTKEESYMIKNLYPLYLHDLSGHYGFLPNRHGVFEDEEDIKTLSEQYEVQNIWWEKPGTLYPFLILVDEIPAGFILVATPPHCSKGIDYFVNECFLLQPYRGKGIAEVAVTRVFDQFTGKWELFTNPDERNIVGKKFWRKTISNYTKENYTEKYGDTFDGYRLVFQFENK